MKSFTAGPAPAKPWDADYAQVGATQDRLTSWRNASAPPESRLAPNINESFWPTSDDSSPSRCHKNIVDRVDGIKLVAEYNSYTQEGFFREVIWETKKGVGQGVELLLAIGRALHFMSNGVILHPSAPSTEGL